MTSVNATAPSQNVYASALVTGLPLSPASIMTLLRRRMQDMDGQVDAIMSEIDTNTARSETLQRQVEALNAVRSAMANEQGDANKKVELGDLTVTYNGETMSADALLREVNIIGIPTDSVNSGRTREQQEDLQAAIQRDMNRRAAGDTEGLDSQGKLEQRMEDVEERLDLNGAVLPTDQVTGAALDGFIESVKSQARRANSGNEVLMVRLQSVMQQRSQTVTMATQMMKSITDSEKSIAQNIGR